jgi:predicted hydrocarbon binding protein
VTSRESSGRTVVVPELFFEALGVRLMKDFGPNAAENLLYEIGRDAGRTFAEKEERDLGHPFRSDREIESLLQRFSGYGWAHIRFRSLDVPGKFAIVEWRDGVAVPRGGSPVPVCHLGRGLLSGAAEVAFGSACDAIETACQAMGRDHCEIVVGIPERVSEVAEQIE